MKKVFLMMLLSFILVIILASCGEEKKEEKDHSSTILYQDTENNDHNFENSTLPNGFPADFPFPENITITEVQDNSEGERKNYTIRFTFDPDIDLDEVFKMYADYTEKVGYEPLLEGEEYFKEGIFQYTALKKMNSSNMFIITMKPSGNTFGSIDLKYTE